MTLADFVKNGKKIVGAGMNYNSRAQHDMRVSQLRHRGGSFEEKQQVITKAQHALSKKQNFLPPSRQSQHCESNSALSTWQSRLPPHPLLCPYAHNSQTPRRWHCEAHKDWDQEMKMDASETHQPIINLAEDDEQDGDEYADVEEVVTPLENTKDTSQALLAEKKLPKPSEPFFFLKPTSSYIVEGQDVKVPAGAVVNEEVELGVIIGKSCKNVTVNEAMNYVGGHCLALDMTEANLVADSQKKGLPWTFGKGFDTACPVSRFVSVEELKDPSDVNIWLKVNGRKIQDANTSDLAFTIPELIASITRYITLEPGDLILTGELKGKLLDMRYLVQDKDFLYLRYHSLFFFLS
uniref:oxaloacetate tautomerase n=1 Tax=Timema douglasi TaxID=61478 RepID=A0A7R8Z4C9_TIMDO|nr:unnamed protein product [Timema douglasi]